jgi:hypothetical protein
MNQLPLDICPHCQAVGSFPIHTGRRKAGLSFPKLLLLFVTVGISFFFVGLARNGSFYDDEECGRCKGNRVF